MRKMLLMFGITAFLLGLSSGAFGLDVPLKYEKAPSDPTVFFPSGYGGYQLSPGMPSGDWKLPVLKTNKPMYAIFKFGDTEFLLLLDVNNTKDNIYSCLFFDSNGNRDLTDDLPINGIIPKNMLMQNKVSYSIEFPPVEMSVKTEGVSIQYSIKPIVYWQEKSFFSPSDEKQISFSVSCAYSGSFKIGNSQYNIRLGDLNANGRFDDKAKFNVDPNHPAHYGISPSADMVYLSDGRKLGQYDGQYLGDLLIIKDKLFDFKIDMAGGKIVLTEIKKGLSKLKISSATELLSLYTVDGSHFLMAYKPSGDVIKIPAGNYKLLGYQMLRKDDQGDLWSMNTVSTIESKPVSVTEKNNAVMNFGEPFTPVVFLPEWFNMNANAYKQNPPLSFVVEGIGKEVIVNLSHIDGALTKIPLSTKRGLNNRPQEPAYSIIKPDGEIVSQGSFEYG